MNPQFADNLTPETVLYDFDGPMIFTARDTDSRMVLVYQCGEDDELNLNHYLIVPFDDDRLLALTRGRMPVLEALSQPWAWRTTGKVGSITALEQCNIGSLPDGFSLPHHSVMLWPSLEPMLSFRMVGEKITKGDIPGSVVKQGITAPSNAISGIAEYLSEIMPDAEPALKIMTDIRVQQITYASFDVGLKMELPEPISPDMDPAKEMKRLLSGALDAASQADYGKKLTSYFKSEDEAKAILGAVRDLTPPSYGIISETHVGGRLVSGGRIRGLTRDARKYVLAHTCTPKQQPDSIQTFIGKIREIDLDKSSFILREIRGIDGERKFKFDYEMADEVNLLWNQQVDVEIAARVRKHRAMGLISISEVASK